MKGRALMVTLLLSTVAFSCKTEKPKQESPAKKPNIIYILADDLGYGEVGCYGQTKIKTPALDQMAAEGMRFTNHYSGQSVCSPSRCSLMTGKHMGHASVKQNGQLLNPQDLTVAEMLKEAGYATGGVGKWGLANGPHADNSACQKGFDQWFGFDNQGFAHFYYPEFMWENHTRIDYPENIGIRDENGHYIEGKGTYIHDVFTEKALSFIKQQGKKDDPFFLYIPYTIPHAELTVPADSRKQYENLGWPETPKTKPGYTNSKSKDQGYGSQYKEGYCAQQRPNMTYAAMVSRMDGDIGKIMDLLKELNIDDNTIIMFASDNGPDEAGGQSMEFFNSTRGMRGYKRSIYEGGIRSPFIVRWPRKIKKGAVSDFPSGFWDFLPTVSELAGTKMPETDGVSLVPTLLSQTKKQKSRDYLYFQWKTHQAIRVGKWKIHRFNSKKKDVAPTYELYDLNKDVKETTNLAESNSEIVDKYKHYFTEAIQ